MAEGERPPGVLDDSIYQSPDGLRKFGRTKSEVWFRNKKAYNASRIDDAAVEAANG
ncbi:hypothetical protein ABIE52_005663 [Rhodococcus sp. OAS809]|uniref:hypothetical protein n=1 Tax=Rhodococcus TaxID=1827 RepID=UPI00038E5841|nr:MULTISPECIES: hypothetical protein [Rhodococcus]ERB50605.1 hypothetical protein N806_05275 [Rhodococcus sp. P27]EQM35589.1 hypothetical protein N601_03695 [Rhodococcus erythropolis DN1]MCZ4546997.1 hypothetical protein [Rhodococcus qingshengii]MDF3314451.1 hypothetical protein [Rhodococcus sp. C3V]MDJ0406670.1 hypothetical protein [Rhodococcus erythropolis]